MANRIAYLGLGAALMYLYDPQSGRKRRADLQQRIDSAGRQLAHARDVVRRDAANRVDGLVAETRGAIEAGKREGIRAGGTSLAQLAQGTARTWQRRHWSPSQRAFAGAFGAAFAMYGYFRGGVKGTAFCAMGSALVARATANDDLSEMLRAKADAAANPADAAAPGGEALEAMPAPPAAGVWPQASPSDQARH